MKIKYSYVEINMGDEAILELPLWSQPPAEFNVGGKGKEDFEIYTFHLEGEVTGEGEE